MTAAVPRRGDVWLAQLDKVRPVVDAAGQIPATSVSNWANPPFQRKLLTWVMAIATMPRWGSLNHVVP